MVTAACSPKPGGYPVPIYRVGDRVSAELAVDGRRQRLAGSVIASGSWLFDVAWDGGGVGRFSHRREPLSMRRVTGTDRRTASSTSTVLNKITT